MPAQPRVDRLKIIYSAAKGLNFSWRLSDYPKTPLNNGVCSYIPQLHRITLRFCKQNECSSGVRNFIEHMLPEFARNNPSITVYVLPIRNSTATMRAEYGNGRMTNVSLKNFTSEQVGQYMNLMRTRCGLPNVKLESRQSADVNSVQGQWNPLFNVNTEQNVTQFPSKKFSQFRNVNQSATDYVKTMPTKA